MTRTALRALAVLVLALVAVAVLLPALAGCGASSGGGYIDPAPVVVVHHSTTVVVPPRPRTCHSVAVRYYAGRGVYRTTTRTVCS